MDKQVQECYILKQIIKEETYMLSVLMWSFFCVCVYAKERKIGEKHVCVYVHSCAFMQMCVTIHTCTGQKLALDLCPHLLPFLTQELFVVFLLYISGKLMCGHLGVPLPPPPISLLELWDYKCPLLPGGGGARL